MITPVKAKKHLGQHFLTDLTIARKIATSLELQTTMPVLEVGPGMGVLTQFLLEDKNCILSVVEVDNESVNYLHKQFPTLPIIEGDFLKIDLTHYYTTPFCVIGNFPYNISSQIFLKYSLTNIKYPVLWV
jgi:16S rRNA (adenine1518-N6/adenine1519-N6)-dimethyltransferase